MMISLIIWVTISCWLYLKLRQERKRHDDYVKECQDKTDNFLFEYRVLNQEYLKNSDSYNLEFTEKLVRRMLLGYYRLWGTSADFRQIERLNSCLTINNQKNNLLR